MSKLRARSTNLHPGSRSAHAASMPAVPSRLPSLTTTHSTAHGRETASDSSRRTSNGSTSASLSIGTTNEEQTRLGRGTRCGAWPPMRKPDVDTDAVIGCEPASLHSLAIGSRRA